MPSSFLTANVALFLQAVIAFNSTCGDATVAGLGGARTTTATIRRKSGQRPDEDRALSLTHRTPFSGSLAGDCLDGLIRRNLRLRVHEELANQILNSAPERHCVLE
jgi:hypothetical protein